MSGKTVRGIKGIIISEKYRQLQKNMIYFACDNLYLFDNIALKVYSLLKKTLYALFIITFQNKLSIISYRCVAAFTKAGVFIVPIGLCRGTFFICIFTTYKKCVIILLPVNFNIAQRVPFNR